MWLNMLPSDHNSLSLLELAVSEGCKIHLHFFGECVENSNIPLLNYLHELEISHDFCILDVKTLEMVRWLYERKYRLDLNTSTPFNLQLDVAEFLHIKGLCSVAILDGSRCLYGTKRDQRLVTSFTEKLFEFTRSTCSYEMMEWTYRQTWFGSIRFEITKDTPSAIDKVKYLRDKGVRINLGVTSVETTNILDELCEMGLNAEQMTANTMDYDICVWRKMRGYHCSMISIKTIENAEWLLENCTSEKINVAGYTYEVGKFIVDESMKREINNIHLQNPDCKMARYMLTVNYPPFMEDNIPRKILSTSNMKLIKEYYESNKEEFVITNTCENDVEVCKFLYSKGLIVFDDADYVNEIYYAVIEFSHPGMTRWLHEVGVITDIDSIREMLPICSPQCRKVLKEFYKDQLI